MRSYSSMWRLLRLVGVLSASLVLAGCVRGCPSSRPPIHINPNMDLQPKYRAQAESEFFYDGSTMRLPIEGTLARGRLRENPELYSGKDASGAFLAVMPVESSEQLSRRGAERYEIYCRPCHDARGRGRGILYERASVPTTSVHDERVVALTDGELFDVITHGKGLMPAYRYPIPAADRWAIIAHVRALQQQGP